MLDGLQQAINAINQIKVRINAALMLDCSAVKFSAVGRDCFFAFDKRDCRRFMENAPLHKPSRQPEVIKKRSV
jgi:hypothetical protein